MKQFLSKPHLPSDDKCILVDTFEHIRREHSENLEKLFYEMNSKANVGERSNKITKYTSEITFTNSIDVVVPSMSNNTALDLKITPTEVILKTLQFVFSAYGL